MLLGTSPSSSPACPPLSRLSARFGPSAVQLDLLADGGWQHLDLAARGRGSIGKAIEQATDECGVSVFARRSARRR